MMSDTSDELCKKYSYLFSKRPSTKKNPSILKQDNIRMDKIT